MEEISDALFADLAVIPEWVLTRTEIRDDCVIWTRGIDHGPTGKPPGQPRTMKIHRYVYEAVNGVALARWQQVLRSCDNPRCVRPSHLVLRECQQF